jgi:hypothetical protein
MDPATGQIGFRMLLLVGLLSLPCDFSRFFFVTIWFIPLFPLDSVHASAFLR